MSSTNDDLKALEVSSYLRTDPDEINQAINQWLTMDSIALDTEFIRTDTYYSQLGLVQIYDGQQVWLIDPLIDGIKESIASLLASTSLTKIVHACSEDLQTLQHYCACDVNNIFDTQLAAALDGYGFSISYRGLVEAIAEVALEKGATRSDWLKRPLDDSQLHYAAADVLYLPEIYQVLSESLQKKQRYEWLQSECEELVRTATLIPDPELVYLKIRRAWQLPADSLLVLQKLAGWRERTAIDKNRPRSWILKDKSLWSLARQLPQSTADLSHIEELALGQQKRYGDTVIQIVSDTLASPGEQRPSALAEPLGREFSAITKSLKSIVSSTAEALGLAPEMLARNKDIEFLLNSYRQHGKVSLPVNLNNWRGPVIGDALCQKVQQYFESNDVEK